MADDAWVRIKELTVPGYVAGGGSVGKDEFSVEFSIKVVYAGCYAISVKLINYHAFTPNETVGYPRGGTLNCYCFAAQEERAFFISATGPAPDGKEALTPSSSDATTLEPIEGKWPTFDFPSDKMQMQVEIDVYECHRGECTREAEKDNCGKLKTSGLSDREPVGHGLRRDSGRTTIVPGGSPEKAIEAGKGAAGLIPK